MFLGPRYGSRDGAAAVRDAAQLVDNRAVQAVDASGFVDAVLAAYPAGR